MICSKREEMWKQYKKIEFTKTEKGQRKLVKD